MMAIVGIGLGAASPARAGGLFLPTHGARGLGRAGALLVGGDDPGGIWYNPALLSRVEGRQILVDANLVLLGVRYTRVDSFGHALPEVRNEAAPIPIPTVAAAIPSPWWGDRVHVGLSFSAPTGALSAFPRPNYGACADPNAPVNCVDTAHADAPQRYTLISLEHSLFAQLDLAVAWQVRRNVAVGLSLQNSLVTLTELKALSSYNGTLGGGPEDPSLDALTQIVARDLFVPSLQLGVLYQPHPDVMLAATFRTPAPVSAGASVSVQLPVSPLYSDSSVEGSRGRIRTTLPMSAGLGVELRPRPRLRVELDLGWEHWSSMKEIRFIPDGIVMKGIPLLGTKVVPEMTEGLNFRDTFSLRIGGAYALPRIPLVLQAGYGIESGAARPQYLSVMALDPTKHIVSVGAGYHLGRYRIDAGYALVLSADRTVDYTQSLAPQANPVSATAARTVGGGRYETMSQILGLGVNISL